MLRKLRRPPRIKVLEAAGALGDGRVNLLEERGAVLAARVVSSDGSRAYNVVIRRASSNAIHAYSDDNGTRYRGYVGYPIIALMMLAGILPRDPAVEKALAGIPWRELNEKYKKYELVESHIRRAIAGRIDWRAVEEYRGAVLRKLSGITVYYDPSLSGESASP